MYYTYVLQSIKDSRYYVGWTTDLRVRFKEHNSGRVESTKRRVPFKLVYYEACLNKDDAKQREKYLKSGVGKKYLVHRLRRWRQLTGRTP